MRRHPPVEHFGDLWHLGETSLSLSGRGLAWVGCVDVASGLLVATALYPLHERHRLEETLQWAVFARGVPEALSVEDGPARRSQRFRHLSRTLELSLLRQPAWSGCARLHHAFWQGERVYLPQMHRLKVTDLDLANALLQAWVDLVYHVEVHPTLARTPLEAFRADPRPTVTPISEEAVRQAFTRCAWRRVTAQGTVSFQRRRYSLLPHLARRRVQLRFWSGDPDAVEVWLPGEDGLRFQQVAAPLPPQPLRPPSPLRHRRQLPQFAQQALDYVDWPPPPEKVADLHHGLSGLSWEQLEEVQQLRQQQVPTGPNPAPRLRL